VILDPFDPAVIAAARENGIEDSWISAAQNSPAYKFVKEWGLSIPLHAEYRTMAMMYYIPPLSPVVSIIEDDLYK
jgi:nitrate reductase beta subunit